MLGILVAYAGAICVGIQFNYGWLVAGGGLFVVGVVFVAAFVNGDVEDA